MAKKVILERGPFVLIIRDGWGYNPDPNEDPYNATKAGNCPVDRWLMAEYPNTLIHTYGRYVGLPDGTMGNSEVGHQNIGAGRVVPQETVRISNAIEDGSFFRNKVLLSMLAYVAKTGGKLHLMGLCSDAGVHALLEHLYALLELARRNQLERVYIHAFTDGRDTPPDSSPRFISQIEARCTQLGVGRIASVMGRFYAMDRDSRWDRIQRAFECLRFGKGLKASSALEAIANCHARELTDEFIEPTCIVNQDMEPVGTIEDGDAVVFFNFRGDRTRELTRAFVDDQFQGFPRPLKPNVCFVCLTEYDVTITAYVAFPKPPKMKNILGAYWSKLGLRQFRCAETEKYAHVTFFFNDYREKPFAGEDRQIVPSPKIRTYDLQPEMSAYQVTDVVLERLDSGKYDVVVVNFANPDMVGHTGVLSAAIKAAEVVDECVGRIVRKVHQLGGAGIITADHGNFEKMIDGSPDKPHTAHTIGDVPLIVFDDRYRGCRLREGGVLADIAPTLLHMMGIPQPKEMTGSSLILA